MDTNIYLRFYSYSVDDLGVLEKVYEKLTAKHFEIVINELLINEFDRRRENHFKETLEYKNDIKINVNTPTLLSDEPSDYEDLKTSEKALVKAAKEYRKKYDIILQKIKLKYINRKLWPDIIINRIFNRANNISLQPEIFEKAKYRLALNNPPGKSNQLCDRIHWELLLHGIEKNHNLIIISNDKDFYSLIETNKINPFLFNEWEKAKESSIEIFKTLTDFLKSYLPEFELPSELSQEIRETIKLLHDSTSFSETHRRISDLEKFYENFTRNHIKLIISCYKNNTQIYGILEDSDVKSFLMKLQKHPHYDSSFNNDIDALLES